MSNITLIRRMTVGLTAVLCAGLIAPMPACAVEEAPPDKIKTNREKPADRAPDRKKDIAREQRGRGYDRLRLGPDGLPMPADRGRSTDARRALDEAKAELSKALSASGGVSTAALENELWRNEEYRSATIELRRAQADYDAVRRPIFDALRADSYYRELENKQQDSQRAIGHLALTGRGNFDWLYPQAMAAMEARNRMTREEIIAMAQAPEVEDARKYMLSVAVKVRALRDGYLAQSNNSETARAAKTELDSARTKLKAAQSEYNAALAEEADYERLRQDYLTELRRTGRAPGE